MLIRAEQMQVFETAAEDNFVQRLAAHLKGNYSAAMVRLPDSESAVGELPAEKLHSLVKISIERARLYNLTHESSISAYSALMFEVSPNFDLHRLSQMMLTDENIEPDARLDEVLAVLTEKNWETIRADYDVNDWQPRAEAVETSEESAAAETSDGGKNSDFAETVMNIEKPESPKKPIAIDDISFDNTIVNFENAKKSAPDKPAADLDLPETMLNIKFDKE